MREPRAIARGLLAAVLVLAGVLLPSGPASAATGQITGQVTGPGGVGMAGVKVVSVTDTSYSLSKLEFFGPQEGHDVATTDANGNYSLTTETGAHYVAFLPKDNTHLSEWYGDTREGSAAQAVNVNSLLPSVGVSAQLTVGGSMSGTVNLPPGSAGWVTVHMADTSYRDVAVDTSDSSFRIGGLPAGDYRLFFNMKAAESEYWQDKRTLAQATVIPLGEGQHLTGLNAVLTPTFHLRGTVTGPDGSGIGAAHVLVHRKGADGTFAYMATFGADSTGTFRLELPAGTYKVGGWHEGYVERWYDGASSVAGATEVTGASDETRTLATIQLLRPVTSSGQLTLSDSTDVGQTLTITHEPTWTPAGTTVTRQWFRGDEPIVGATAATYTLVRADIGQLVSVQERGAADGYAPASVQSSPRLVKGVRSTASPVVSGPHAVGGTLQASTGNWVSHDGSRLAFAYQWIRGVSLIAGATGPSYLLRPEDTGQEVRVRVTASIDAYAEAARSLPATIAPGTFSSTAAPAVSGAARVGRTLSRTVGTWSPAGTYTTQWFRGAAAIPGATGASYAVQPADVGQRLSVRVTASRPGFTSASRASAPTAAVVRGTFAITRVGWISGTLRRGYTLTANRPTTTPQPTVVRYQWLRNGRAIRGATYRRYRLTSYDRGKQIAVRIVMGRPGYLALTRTLVRSGYVR